MKKQVLGIVLSMIMMLSFTACGSEKETGPINSNDKKQETFVVESEPEIKEESEEEIKEEQPEESEEEAAARALEEAAEQAKAKYQEGLDYWFAINGREYDMEKARNAFQESADGGYADALCWLAVIARYSVDPDKWEKVADYVDQAVDEGSSLGLYYLGFYHQKGKGFEQDYAKAYDYYMQAADAGCLMGYVGLEELYRVGSGVEADGAKAIEYAEKAIDSDDWWTRNSARYAIGTVYLYGAEGIEKDFEKAKEWLLPSAEDEYVYAVQGMGTLYEVFMEGEDYLEKAFEWYEKAAEYGNMYSYGCNYAYGVTLEQDIPRAIEIFKESENGGRQANECLAYVAYLYYKGNGVEKDTDLAKEYALKAIDADSGATESPNYGTGLAKAILEKLGD